jgi:hypothetical protein
VHPNDAKDSKPHSKPGKSSFRNINQFFHTQWLLHPIYAHSIISCAPTPSSYLNLNVLNVRSSAEGRRGRNQGHQMRTGGNIVQSNRLTTARTRSNFIHKPQVLHNLAHLLINHTFPTCLRAPFLKPPSHYYPYLSHMPMC